MWPDENTGAISINFSIKNLSNSTKKIYPARGVDTMLAGDDNIPIYSAGYNKGVYMKTDPAYGDYLFDYSMDDYQSSPIEGDSSNGKTPYYAGAYLSSSFGVSTMFNHNYEKTSMWHMTKNNGFSLVPAGEDTAIYMYWGPVTLNSRGVFNGGYQVNIRDLGIFNLTNDMNNLSTKDGLNYPKDEIKYNSVIKAPESSDFSNLVYQYKLSTNLDKPSKIVFDGKDYPIDSVYDSSTQTVSIPFSNLKKDQHKKVEITTRILPDAAKDNIIGKAAISGTNELGLSKKVSKDNNFDVEEAKLVL